MKSIKKIYFLTPSIAGGVSDFSTILNKGLEDRGLRIKNLKFRKIRRGDIIFINYSGYGFSKIGSPFILCLLLLLYSKFLNIKVITFFHELFIPTYDFNIKRFLIQGFQKLCVNILVRSSKFILCNNQMSFGYLKRFDFKKTKVCKIPVFSNMGELSRYPIDRSEENILIFGSLDSRKKIYSLFRSEIERFCKEKNVTVFDCGEIDIDLKLMISSVFSNAVVLGKISVQTFQHTASLCAYGVFTYDPRFVEKSGILASYCSHGLSPVLISDLNYSAPEGLEFISVNKMPLENYLNSTKAYCWYVNHSSEHFIDIIHKKILSLNI